MIRCEARKPFNKRRTATSNLLIAPPSRRRLWRSTSNGVTLHLWCSIKSTRLRGLRMIVKIYASDRSTSGHGSLRNNIALWWESAKLMGQAKDNDGSQWQTWLTQKQVNRLKRIGFSVWVA